MRHHRHRSKCKHSRHHEERQERLLPNSSWPKLSTHHSYVDADTSDTRVHRHSRTHIGSRDRLSTVSHESRSCNPAQSCHGRTRNGYCNSPHRSSSPLYQRRPSSADPRFHRIVQEESPQVIEIIGQDPMESSRSPSPCNRCGDSKKKSLRTKPSDCKRTMSLSPSNIRYYDNSYNCCKGVQTDQQQQSHAGRTEHIVNSDGFMLQTEKERNRHDHRSHNVTKYSHSSKKLKNQYINEGSLHNNTEKDQNFSCINRDSEYQMKQMKDEKNCYKQKREDSCEIENPGDHERHGESVTKSSEKRVHSPSNRRSLKHGWLMPSGEPTFDHCERNINQLQKKSQDKIKHNLDNLPKSMCRKVAGDSVKNDGEKDTDAEHQNVISSNQNNITQTDINNEETENESDTSTSNIEVATLNVNVPRLASIKNKVSQAAKRNSPVKTLHSSHKIRRKQKFRTGHSMKDNEEVQYSEKEKTLGTVNYDRGKQRTWIMMIMTIAAVIVFGAIAFLTLFYVPPSVFHWLFDYEDEEHTFLLFPRLFGKSSM